MGRFVGRTLPGVLVLRRPRCGGGRALLPTWPAQWEESRRRGSTGSMGTGRWGQKDHTNGEDAIWVFGCVLTVGLRSVSHEQGGAFTNSA